MDSDPVSMDLDSEIIENRCSEGHGGSQKQNTVNALSPDDSGGGSGGPLWWWWWTLSWVWWWWDWGSGGRKIESSAASSINIAGVG
jgi:hypothetical protein